MYNRSDQPVQIKHFSNSLAEYIVSILFLIFKRNNLFDTVSDLPDCKSEIVLKKVLHLKIKNKYIYICVCMYIYILTNFNDVVSSHLILTSYTVSLYVSVTNKNEMTYSAHCKPSVTEVNSRPDSQRVKEFIVSPGH